MRLSGHSPSQEAKCASVFQRVMSTPTSLMRVWATRPQVVTFRVTHEPLHGWLREAARAEVSRMSLGRVDAFMCALHASRTLEFLLSPPHMTARVARRFCNATV